MAEQRDRGDDELPLDRLRSAFVDAAPRTVEDVAVAADADPETVRSGLRELCASGVLASRSVSGVDITARKAAEAAEIDVEEPITLYYPTPGELADAAVDPSDADDEIGRRLQRMAVPGASDLMRSWRRDAVRATYEHLVAAGGATPQELRSTVFPAHEAGFDDPDAWWRFVRPRLYRLPAVAVEDGEWFVEQRPAPRRG